MKPITLEWVEKAEGDYASAHRELRARKNPNYNAACFHEQQCAEKYLKARLQEAEIPFLRLIICYFCLICSFLSNLSWRICTFCSLH